MDDTKREELEKACKKETNHKVRTRMVAVRMVRVRNMSVEETADIRVRCSMWVRNYTDDQKFVRSVTYFLLVNFKRSGLNLTVR